MSSARTIGIRALAVLAAGALLGGCGVPTETGVEVQGPLAGAGPTEDQQPVFPPGPDDARTPDQLVDFYLQAAAADPDRAVEHMREFIHPDHADGWEPASQVLVVRVKDQFPTPGDPVRVRVDARVVGSLSRGMVEPVREPRDIALELEVAAEPTGVPDSNLGDPGGDLRYRIVNPPPMILLSDRALAGSSAGYLTPSPIYFWDADHEVLVPDLRWLPTSLSAAGRAQTKLKWLVDGPTPWLSSVASLPGEVDLVGNVVSREDRLDVALTPAAGDIEASRLHAQLWWTLHEEVNGDRSVWLSIDGQERELAAAGPANPSVTAPPASYVLLDGLVTPYTPNGRTVPPAWVTDFEGDIQAAALSREGRAALVHTAPDGMHRFALVTAAGVSDADLSAQTMTRPTWLRRPKGTGLIAADGVLHAFTIEDPEPTEVTVPGVAGPVTALAVAPDGRRLALIAGDELYVASLAHRDDGALSVNQPRRLDTTASGLAGVAFWRENFLAVIGEEEGRNQLYEITVDGAFEKQLTNGDLGGLSVTHMVGYPGSPLEQSMRQRGEVLFEADGRVYRYKYLQRPVDIGVEDLAVEVPEEALESHLRAPFYTE
jgi:hypothetical protein